MGAFLCKYTQNSLHFCACIFLHITANTTNAPIQEHFNKLFKNGGMIAVTTVICKVGYYRECLEISQRKLAACVGTGSASISLIESGRRLPNVLMAIKIARVLQTTVENLWEEKIT